MPASQSATFHSPAPIRLPRAMLWALTLRELRRSALNSVLSMLAMAMAVAIVIAVEVTTQAIRNALAGSEEARTLMAGLIDQFGITVDVAAQGVILATGFVVFNAFGMSLTRRRRRLGALRALGMTRGQTLQVMLLEALLIAALGIGLGWLTGPVLGRATILAAKALMGESYFVFEPSPPSPARLLQAAGFALGVALLAAWIPAWGAIRLSPLEARRAETAAALPPERRRWAWLGIATAAALWTILVLAPPGNWIEPPWGGRLALLLVGLWLACLAATLPALIGAVGGLLRIPLTHIFGATGVLLADNVRRARRRVSLTVGSVALAVAMVIGAMGFIRFTSDSLMIVKMREVAQLGAFAGAAFDFTKGMAGMQDMDNLFLGEAEIEAVRELVRGRADTSVWRFVIVPELSFFGSSYFSFLMHPDEMREGRDWAFTFNEGDWNGTMHAMRSGCGLLVTPKVAASLRAAVGDEVPITGAHGPVSCTLAGIGSAYVAASVIGTTRLEDFAGAPSFTILISPLPGVDRHALAADLADLDAQLPGLAIGTIEAMTQSQTQVIGAMPNLINVLLLLAMVAAAMSVANTFAMVVVERRAELALLWAVGASRRTLWRLVAGEAALIGLIGSLLGFLAGAGVTLIVPTAGGGADWGMVDLDLWTAALSALRAVTPTGLASMALAPLLALLAARFAMARSLHRLSVRELTPEGL